MKLEGYDNWKDTGFDEQFQGSHCWYCGGYVDDDKAYCCEWCEEMDKGARNEQSTRIF